MEEEEIIKLFQERSESAISNLAEKYGGNCLSIAKNILQNREDSEECVNDCYFVTWNGIPPTIPNSLKAFVFRVTRNIAIKKYHSNTAQKRNSIYDVSLEELKEVLASVETPEHCLLSQELTQYLNQFLEGLQREQQIMFTLRYWYNQSAEEIGQKLQIKPNTVTVKLKRIREKLKKFLKEKGYGHDG